MVAKTNEMIYNVYQGGRNMQAVVSKWGNSLGIRIPTSVVNALNIDSGDTLDYEVRGNELVFQKNRTTKRIFEDFFGKPYDQITSEDIGSGEEIDWGYDVGGEVIV